MNTNSGNDPMLSGLINDDWGKLTATSSTASSPAPSLGVTQSSSAFIIPTYSLLIPETSASLTDLASMWPSERKRVPSIKMMDDDAFASASPYSAPGDMDNDIELEEMDIASNTTVTDIKSEIEDEFDDPHISNALGSQECKQEVNDFMMTESEARRFVEKEFEKIAFLPSSDLSQRDKISFILSRSDCNEFSAENVINFDKKSLESARACARIVQNIPQRYRWECVNPEDIPCCYTIVADCKKVSSRDKPPRPMNAFMIWAQGARRLINELCPKMQNALISEALGYFWRQKSDSFKKRFEQEKIKLRRFHNVEFPEYKYKPKTKVQKAKEKQELSQTKAKMRASVKREKVRLSDESNLYQRRQRCGRPRKGKSVAERKDPNRTLSTEAGTIGEKVSTIKPATKYSSKPAIKDMLTLKILNDRKSKTQSDSKEAVNSAYGQLSPLEIDSTYVSNIFDDPSSLKMALTGHVCQNGDNSTKNVASSVYDTPANTPPVEVDDDLHFSPLQQQQPPSATPPSSTESPPQKFNNIPTNAAEKLRRSRISAMQISPSDPLTSVNTELRHLPEDRVVKLANPSTNSLILTAHADRVSDFSDLLFTYVTEALSTVHKPEPRVTECATFKCSAVVIDKLKKTSDVCKIARSDSNNNDIEGPLSYAASFVTAAPLNLFDSGDLDTLHLDLHVPILSDDDMRSLLSTL